MRPRQFLFAFVCACALTMAQTDPVVTLQSGMIRGRKAPDGGAWFKGIPYAQPPVGDLRWRIPQPLERWEGIRDADKFAPACTQLSEGWNAKYVTGSTEDCLYLNVATPKWPPSNGLPVFVWIHGGSNTAGSGETAGFDQRTMVKQGLILVTINYRLGALGFLAHPDLTAESPQHASGNYGLMDQVAALEWVQKNIARFGGNPDNVTVAGQSAGAFDISLLMTSPLARGLFRRAIAESGAVSGFKGSMTASHAAAIGKRLAAGLKAPDTETLAFLRKVAPEEILTAARAAAGGDRTGLETSIDGWVLPASPTEIFASGRALPVALIVGSNAQEVNGPTTAAKLRETIEKTYGTLAPQALKLYGLEGQSEGRSDPLYGSPGTQWSTDTGFRCPAMVEAFGHSRSRTYLYEFQHPQPGRPATAHSSELNFIFGTWGPGVQLTPMDRKVSQQVLGYWVNFAKTGDPNGTGLPEWPLFTGEGLEYLAFTGQGAVAKQRLRRDYCAVFLDSLASRK